MFVTVASIGGGTKKVTTKRLHSVPSANLRAFLIVRPMLFVKMLCLNAKGVKKASGTKVFQLKRSTETAEYRGNVPSVLLLP